MDLAWTFYVPARDRRFSADSQAVHYVALLALGSDHIDPDPADVLQLPTINRSRTEQRAPVPRWKPRELDSERREWHDILVFLECRPA